MSRLINADEPIEKYNKKFVCKADCISENKKLSRDFRFFCRLVNAVESATTIDAVPAKHGHWVDFSGNYIRIENDGWAKAKGGVWCSK